MRRGYAQSGDPTGPERDTLDLMRTLVLVGLLCVACSRDNPAFGGTSGEDVGGPGTVGTGPGTVGTGPGTVGTGPLTLGTGLDTSGPGTVGTGVDTLDPDTIGPETSGEDVPIARTCELQPALGARIEVMDPTIIGGQCPTMVDLWVQVVSNDGAEVLLDGCTGEGCGNCGPAVELHPLSMEPLMIGDHLPPGTCLFVQARAPLDHTPDRCRWGALTVLGEAAIPYVIATTASADPTQAGIEALEGAVPAPIEGTSCSCDSVGERTDCCHQSQAPAFWYYPIGDAEVYQGDEPVPVTIESSAGLEYAFHVFQAQQIPCGDVEPRFSWAAVATL